MEGTNAEATSLWVEDDSCSMERLGSQGSSIGNHSKGESSNKSFKQRVVVPLRWLYFSSAQNRKIILVLLVVLKIPSLEFFFDQAPQEHCHECNQCPRWKPFHWQTGALRSAQHIDWEGILGCLNFFLLWSRLGSRPCPLYERLNGGRLPILEPFMNIS